MKKLMALSTLAITAGVLLTGCSAGYLTTDTTGNTASNPVTAESYGLDEVYYQLPDERFVECFEYRLGNKRGSLTCELVTEEPKNYTPAVDTFDVVYITDASEDSFVCLDYRLGNQRGALSCVAGLPR